MSVTVLNSSFPNKKKHTGLRKKEARKGNSLVLFNGHEICFKLDIFFNNVFYSILRLLATECQYYFRQNIFTNNLKALFTTCC